METDGVGGFRGVNLTKKFRSGGTDLVVFQDLSFQIAPGERLALIGESVASKRSRVQSELNAIDGLVVTDPHNLAWLFNIRGADVAHTPIALGLAYVPKAGVQTLLLDPRKLSP